MTTKKQKIVKALTAFIAATFVSGSILVSILYLKNKNNNKKQTIEEFANSIKLKTIGNNQDIYASYLANDSFVKTEDNDENYSYELIFDPNNVNDKEGILYVDIKVTDRKNPSNTYVRHELISGFKKFVVANVLNETEGLNEKFNDIEKLKSFLNKLPKSFYGIQQLIDNKFLTLDRIPQNLGIKFDGYSIVSPQPDEYILNIKYKVLGELKTYMSSEGNVQIFRDDQSNIESTITLDASKFVKDLVESEHQKNLKNLNLIKNQLNALLTDIDNSKSSFANDSYNNLKDEVVAKLEDLNKYNDNLSQFNLTVFEQNNNSINVLKNRKNKIDLTNIIEQAEILFNTNKLNYSDEINDELKNEINKANDLLTNQTKDKYEEEKTLLNNAINKYIQNINKELQNAKTNFINWKENNDNDIQYLNSLPNKQAAENEILNLIETLNQFLPMTISETNPKIINSNHADLILKLNNYKNSKQNKVENVLSQIQEFISQNPSDNNAKNNDWNEQEITINSNADKLANFLAQIQNNLDSSTLAELDEKEEIAKKVLNELENVKKAILDNLANQINEQLNEIKPLIEKAKEAKYDSIDEKYKKVFDVNEAEGENFKKAIDNVENGSVKYLDENKHSLTEILNKLIEDKDNLNEQIELVDDRNALYKNKFRKAKESIDNFKNELTNNYEISDLSQYPEIKNKLDEALNNLVEDSDINTFTNDELNQKLENIKNQLKDAQTEANKVVNNFKNQFKTELDKLKIKNQYILSENQKGLLLDENASLQLQNVIDEYSTYYENDTLSIDYWKEHLQALKTRNAIANIALNDALNGIVEDSQRLLNEFNSFEVNEDNLSDKKDDILQNINNVKSVATELQNDANKKDDITNKWAENHGFSFSDFTNKMNTVREALENAKHAKTEAINNQNEAKQNLQAKITDLNELIEKAKNEYDFKSTDPWLKDIEEQMVGDWKTDEKLSTKTSTYLNSKKIELQNYIVLVNEKIQNKTELSKTNLENKLDEVRRYKDHLQMPSANNSFDEAINILPDLDPIQNIVNNGTYSERKQALADLTDKYNQSKNKAEELLENKRVILREKLMTFNNLKDKFSNTSIDLSTIYNQDSITLAEQNKDKKAEILDETNPNAIQDITDNVQLEIDKLKSKLQEKNNELVDMLKAARQNRGIVIDALDSDDNFELRLIMGVNSVTHDRNIYLNELQNKDNYDNVNLIDIVNATKEINDKYKEVTTIKINRILNEFKNIENDTRDDYHQETTHTEANQRIDELNAFIASIDSKDLQDKISEIKTKTNQLKELKHKQEQLDTAMNNWNAKQEEIKNLKKTLANRKYSAIYDSLDHDQRNISLFVSNIVTLEIINTQTDKLIEAINKAKMAKEKEDNDILSQITRFDMGLSPIYHSLIDSDENKKPKYKNLIDNLNTLYQNAYNVNIFNENSESAAKIKDENDKLDAALKGFAKNKATIDFNEIKNDFNSQVLEAIRDKKAFENLYNEANEYINNQEANVSTNQNASEINTIVEDVKNKLDEYKQKINEIKTNIINEKSRYLSNKNNANKYIKNKLNDSETSSIKTELEAKLNQLSDMFNPSEEDNRTVEELKQANDEFEAALQKADDDFYEQQPKLYIEKELGMNETEIKNELKAITDNINKVASVTRVPYQSNAFSNYIGLDTRTGYVFITGSEQDSNGTGNDMPLNEDTNIITKEMLTNEILKLDGLKISNLTTEKIDQIKSNIKNTTGILNSVVYLLGFNSLRKGLSHTNGDNAQRNDIEWSSGVLLNKVDQIKWNAFKTKNTNIKYQGNNQDSVDTRSIEQYIYGFTSPTIYDDSIFNIQINNLITLIKEDSTNLTKIKERLEQSIERAKELNETLQTQYQRSDEEIRQAVELRFNYYFNTAYLRWSLKNYLKVGKFPKSNNSNEDSKFTLEEIANAFK
ncbi:hypothetical protein [Mycoplasmopsis lipofaciens]|uniref:hypothetical protein n=1 Tax=Mycoplasmopsis lipofaciens TaxID=114884 RepID=UPI00048264B9|nr:hypothetical protein [Mycoplasmopsis lipofaciens]